MDLQAVDNWLTFCNLVLSETPASLSATHIPFVLELLHFISVLFLDLSCFIGISACLGFDSDLSFIHSLVYVFKKILNCLDGVTVLNINVTIVFVQKVLVVGNNVLVCVGDP